MVVKLFQPSEAAFLSPKLRFTDAKVRETQTLFNASQNQLKTAYHVSPPKEDPYQIVINERARLKVRKLAQSFEDAQNGMLQMKIAATGLKSARNVLLEMRSLALKAADASTADGDRVVLNTKLSELPAELDELVNRMKYNQTKLMDGSFSANFKLGRSAHYHVKVKIDDMRSVALELNSLDISSKAGAASAYTKIDVALEKLQVNVGRVKGADKKIATILSTRTSLSESISDNSANLRNRSAARDMIDIMKVQLLQPDATAISPKELHKTNNHTVLDLLANAMDLPFRS